MEFEQTAKVHVLVWCLFLSVCLPELICWLKLSLVQLFWDKILACQQERWLYMFDVINIFVSGFFMSV